MTISNIECLGSRRCPKGPNNRARWLCPHYTECAEQLMLRNLDKTNSVVGTMKVIKSVLNDSEGYGFSDFFLLHWMGQVASKNGFHFGRKKVDRAIRLSKIDEDGETASAEKSLVRLSFGVYGREGAKTALRGLTEGTEWPEATSEGAQGIDSSSERMGMRGRTDMPAFVVPAVCPTKPKEST